MTNMNIEQVRESLMGLGKVFHKICIKHNIPYYMIGGTMLGSIRHKGFIPWDDDMDFAVPRKYFNILEEACKKELKYPYALIEAKKGFHVHPYLKIQDLRTVVKDPATIRFNTEQGINIDIFFLDDCSLDKSKIEPFMFRKRTLDNIGTALFSEPQRDSIIAKLGTMLIRVVFFWVSPKRWINWYHKLEKDISKTGDEAMMSISSHYGVKEVISKKIWGTPQLYEFDGIQLYGPEDYDGYLKSLFKNYMQLPPEKDRIAHCEGYFYK